MLTLKLNKSDSILFYLGFDFIFHTLYFITIFDTDGGELVISDDYNTKFYSLEKKNDFLGKTFVTYYAHMTNLNPQYSVIVNDNKIVLGQ